LRYVQPDPPPTFFTVFSHLAHSRPIQSARPLWHPLGTTRKEAMMLILTRRIGEQLLIGDNVQVRVLAVKGNQVRIGIEAPADVSVMRDELISRKPPDQKPPSPG